MGRTHRGVPRHHRLRGLADTDVQEEEAAAAVAVDSLADMARRMDTPRASEKSVW